MKTISLTEKQEWFIKCAIRLKDAVLPLHPAILNDKLFEDDYGISKKEMEREIRQLEEKLMK